MKKADIKRDKIQFLYEKGLIDSVPGKNHISEPWHLTRNTSDEIGNNIYYLSDLEKKLPREKTMEDLISLRKTGEKIDKVDITHIMEKTDDEIPLIINEWKPITKSPYWVSKMEVIINRKINQLILLITQKTT